MKLVVPPGTQNLCEQCVALCCRYYAFEIDKPTTHRDFEDLRWYLYHDDTIIFIEEGHWFVQVNRPCKALLPDNRCGVYESRPTICRGYTTKGCDWHGDDYDYDELFTEPEQIQRYGKQFLAERRRRKQKRSASKAREKTKIKSKVTLKAKSVGKLKAKPATKTAAKTSKRKAG